MEIVIKKRPHTVLSEGGIPFCEVSVHLPEAVGEGKAAERLSRFYSPMEKECLSFAKECVLPLAKDAYEKSADPRRRFTHRPYRIELACSLDGINIKRRLTVTHRGRILFERAYSEKIDNGGGVVPNQKKKIRA